MTQQEENDQRLRPTSAEVIAALRDAGWLLEQDTAATLEKGGFHVATAKAFPEPDDPSVSREIDVHGYRQLFRSDDLSLSVGTRMLAECKQSSMPYVVVGGPASAYELGRDRQEQHFRSRASRPVGPSLAAGALVFITRAHVSIWASTPCRATHGRQASSAPR